MGNKVKEYKELCEKCGAEVQGVDYVNRCDQTGHKGFHWRCDACGKVSKTCKRIKN